MSSMCHKCGRQIDEDTDKHCPRCSTPRTDKAVSKAHNKFRCCFKKDKLAYQLGVSQFMKEHAEELERELKAALEFKAALWQARIALTTVGLACTLHPECPDRGETALRSIAECSKIAGDAINAIDQALGNPGRQEEACQVQEVNQVQEATP